MTYYTLLQTLTVVLVVISTTMSVAAFIRVGKWRLTDVGKQISEDIQALKSGVTTDSGGTVKADIHKIRNEITKIEVRLGSAEKANDRVASIEGRMASIETQLQHMASRSDVSELRGEILGMKSMVAAAEEGVKRIETYLMERGS